MRHELVVDVQRRARDPRDELDRAIVVRRPEAAGDEADVRFSACPKGDLEVVRVVADDRDPLRSKAERERLSRVERAVRVASLAAHELAARDDDRRARAAHPAMAVGPLTRSRPVRGSVIG